MDLEGTEAFTIVLDRLIDIERDRAKTNAEASVLRDALAYAHSETKQLRELLIRVSSEDTYRTLIEINHKIVNDIPFSDDITTRLQQLIAKLEPIPSRGT